MIIKNYFVIGVELSTPPQQKNHLIEGSFLC